MKNNQQTTEAIGVQRPDGTLWPSAYLDKQEAREQLLFDLKYDSWNELVKETGISLVKVTVSVNS